MITATGWLCANARSSLLTSAAPIRSSSSCPRNGRRPTFRSGVQREAQIFGERALPDP